MDLSDAEAMTSSEAGSGNGSSQGVAGVTFDPSMSVTASPALRTRRDSASSSVSDASGLFPIYEVPGVSFNMPQVKGYLLYFIRVVVLLVVKLPRGLCKKEYQKSFTEIPLMSYKLLCFLKLLSNFYTEIFLYFLQFQVAHFDPQYLV